MKKTVVWLLLFLAIVAAVSPGIIGILAEQQIEENLKLAVDPDNGVIVTSLDFDRGWFSSAGQHRLELTDSEIAATLGLSGGPPALIIDTRLDHGLIPVASMGREQGTLTPGLGSAISTLALDLGEGKPVDLPGTVYSKIGVTGKLQAHFVLPAGERSTPDGMLRWAPGQLAFSSDSGARRFVFSGDLAGSIEMQNDPALSDLPLGTVFAATSIDVPETELATLNWSSLLQSMAASIDLEVPAALIDLSLLANPELEMVIGLGYLKKNGDSYTLNARLEQGLLTVNGAPVPLPLGAFR